MPGSNSGSANRPGALRLLGQPEFRWHGREFALPSKFYALALMLVSRRDRWISRSEVIAALWGPPEDAKVNAAFRQFIARIRKIERQIGAELLLCEQTNITLARDSVEVDLIRLLETDVTEAIGRGDRDTLRAFISSAGQRLLEGVEAEGSFSDYRTRVECRLADAETRAIIALINSDEGHDSEFDYEGLALRLIQLDSAQELGYRILMEHYCETDRRAMAREIYQRCKAKLLSEYGLHPELSTRQLAASLGLEARLEIPQGQPESRVSDHCA